MKCICHTCFQQSACRFQLAKHTALKGQSGLTGHYDSYVFTVH